MGEKKTLNRFVKECGNTEKAAVIIGVSFTTLYRWLRGAAKPRGLSAERLKYLGIRLP